MIPVLSDAPFSNVALNSRVKYYFKNYLLSLIDRCAVHMCLYLLGIQIWMVLTE